MRHWWIYIILYSAVGAFGLSPFAGTDIAKLSPVETVWLEEKEGVFYIETDGGDAGVGRTLEDALENMKQTSPGTVFLDTADFLIVQKGDAVMAKQMKDILRPSCSICLAAVKPDLQTATQFLRTHEPRIKMKTIDVESMQLPLLQNERGRLILIENKLDSGAANGVAGRGIQRADSEPCGQN